ncbi:hypothetical protein [Prevotella nigrescens]
MVNPFRVTVRTATELLLSSQRGYGSCRNGVTAVVATGLRQLPQRGYDKHRFGTPVNTATWRCRNTCFWFNRTEIEKAPSCISPVPLCVFNCIAN